MTPEPYRPSDRSLSEKLVSTYADSGCHVVSLTDPYYRILGKKKHIRKKVLKGIQFLRTNK
jgi:hypothetical protein